MGGGVRETLEEETGETTGAEEEVCGKLDEEKGSSAQPVSDRSRVKRSRKCSAFFM